RFVSTLEMNGQSIPSIVAPEAVILAFSVSAAVGLFFGIYPAMRASRLDPIDALRYEQLTSEGTVRGVDDDRNVTQLVRLYLSSDGFRVESATNGQEALEKAHQVRPDLIVLD